MVFAALNDSGVVYDGRVVVDCAMRTSDPNIYAAGSCAKLSRRYGDRVLLQEYNSRSTGAVRPLPSCLSLSLSLSLSLLPAQATSPSPHFSWTVVGSFCFILDLQALVLCLALSNCPSGRLGRTGSMAAQIMP